MPVKDAIVALRKRFNRLRHGQTFLDLQAVIEVPRARLSVFASGGLLKLPELQKIEEWCDDETRRHWSKQDAQP